MFHIRRLSPFMLFMAGLLLAGLLHGAAMADGATIRPGDIIEVTLPGEPAFEEPFQVDPEGDLILPETGRVHVEGLTLDEASARIADDLAVAYRDLSRLEVHLVERRLVVDVLGYVGSPGRVDLPEGSNVQAALVAAGGLAQGAQLDRLQLQRAGETITFDYKAYLDSGDPSKLPQLLPMDVVFVPASPLIGNVQVEFDAQTLTSAGDAGEDATAIKVFGEVQQPGTFAFRDGQSVVDLIMRAGGVTRYAAVESIRVMTGSEPALFDLKAFLDSGDPSLAPVLRPGSTIFVPEKDDEVNPSWLAVSPDRAVHVMGAVQRPGRYEWSDEMSVLDLIAHAGGPNARADTSQVQIISVEGDDALPQTFDLGRFLSEGGRLSDLPAIHAGYTIMVPELPTDPTDNKSQWVQQSSDRSIYVMGAVGSPGRYAFNEALDFLDILAAADGPTTTADIRNIRVSHRDGEDARISKVDMALYFETGDGSLLPRVLPGDVIFVPDLNREWTQIDSDQTVRVLGAVGTPGRYSFDDSMSILDLLAEAGGPTGNAWQERIVVVNMTSDGPAASSFDLVAFARSGDYTALPVLRPGDTIYVPSTEQSDWAIFMNGVTDVVQMLSVVALVAAL